MNDIDAGFMEVVQSCTGAEGEVDYSDDGWKPADGDYTVLLERFTTGTKEKNGIQNGTGKAIFRIVDGEFEGRSFGEFFWLPSNPQAITQGMRNLLCLGTCLCGRELKVAEFAEAVEHIRANAGNVLLNVTLVSNTSKKDGKVYTNAKFKGVIAEEESA